MVETPSLVLLARWRDAGDQRAVEEFLDRHLPRLIAVVRQRLSTRLGRRFDPEDVVQSACRSFCVRIRDGRLDVESTDSFEQLLVRITLNKLFTQVEHHQAAKRAVQRELPPERAASGPHLRPEPLSREPAPDELLAVHEELENILQNFQPLHRRMIELRLLGYGTSEIAAESQRTERMVRKVLAAFEGLALQRMRTTST
jgi:RNA polymerase sigma-70 factor (ECF subfamily)